MPFYDIKLYFIFCLTFHVHKNTLKTYTYNNTYHLRINLYHYIKYFLALAYFFIIRIFMAVSSQVDGGTYV